MTLRLTRETLPVPLAGAALVAGAALNLFAPQPYAGLPLLAAAPLIVAPVPSFLASAVFACLAPVLSLCLDLYNGRPADAIVVDLAVVTLIGVLALLLDQLIARQTRTLSRSRAIAEAVQHAVVPQPPPRVGGLSVAAVYSAAQTEARIGGDLYAVQDTPFGTRGLVADVRGKGMQAVEAVTVLIGAFRQEAERGPSLNEVADRLDAAMVRYTQRSETSVVDEEFATAVLFEIAPDCTRLSVVNRGHPSPYFVGTGQVRRLDPSEPQLPLGLGDSVSPEFRRVAADTWAFPRGTAFLLVTDGVTEARDGSGAFYDPCFARLTPRACASVSELVKAVMADVGRWTDHTPQDDVAIMALQRVDDAPGRPASAADALGLPRD
ncbi:PP2C family protein-serine/threonine phosphatase [Streptomyces cellulosae]